MKQNHPTPTAACAAFASLLPLTGHDLLNASDDASLRAHLATCAACRAELAIYDRVELAWRRALEPRQEAAPLVSSKALLDILTDEADRSEPSTAPVVPGTRAARRAHWPRSRRLQGALSALAAVLLIAVIAGAAWLAHARISRLGGPPAPSQPPYQNISDSTFADISMVSPTEGWAVGGAYTAFYPHTSDPTTLTEQVLLWHYLNGAWTPVQLHIHGQLASISMDSPTDGWAIGENGYFQGQDPLVLLHYDGLTWKQVPSQGIQALILNQVQMLSPTDGWIVGEAFSSVPGSSQPAHSGIWHYNGRTWQEEPAPAGLRGLLQHDDLQVSSISMLSPTEGWAVATLTPVVEISPSSTPTTTHAPADLSPSGVILHYTNGRWEVQKMLPETSLQALSMVSPADGWVGGARDTRTLMPDPNAPGVGVTQDTTAPLLLHFTQGRWVDATSSVSIKLSAIDSFQWVSMRAANDGWLAFSPKNRQYSAPGLLHYNGTQWNAVSLPIIKNTSIYTLARVFMTSPTEGWAVGSRVVTGSRVYTYLNVPIILHFHNGTWSVTQS